MSSTLSGYAVNSRAIAINTHGAVAQPPLHCSISPIRPHSPHCPSRYRPYSDAILLICISSSWNVSSYTPLSFNRILITQKQDMNLSGIVHLCVRVHSA